jgi:A/G-specific adenine glycosylase
VAKKTTTGPALIQPKANAAAAEAELAQNAEQFHKHLNVWYREHARELPWRGVSNPYATWLSEIMLQQTRVATVIDRYQEFLEKFPTIESLAAADESEVLALWSGLGYYRRARMLHRGAQFVARELDGRLPRTAVELRTLPGIGAYTGAAIASIAFGESVAVVDGNVERVLFRVLGLPEDKTAEARARLTRVAQSLVPPAAKRRGRTNPPGDHNQAMMELGATICTPKSPLCLQCPVMKLCRTRGEHPTAPRSKQSSRIVAYLVALRKAGTTTEVLLERRADNASLMAGMFELPALPLSAIEGREPVLRVRHAITNTNYYAQIFSEGAPATSPPTESEHEELFEEDEIIRDEHGDPGVFTKPQEPAGLILEIPASQKDLFWTSTRKLRGIPLTGLARKSLQRLGVMEVPPVRIG